MRLVTVIAAATLALATAPAFAQTAPDPARESHLDLAGRYLELTQGGEVVKQMRRQLEEGYTDTGLPDEQRAWMTENMAGLLAEVIDETLELLRDDVADDFTVQELEAAIEFYESPVGRSLVRKQVELNFETQQVMMPLLMPRMASLMEKFCVRFDCGALGDAAAKSAR